MPFTQEYWNILENASNFASLEGNKTNFTSDVSGLTPYIRDALASSKNEIFLSVRPAYESGPVGIIPSILAATQLTFYYEIRVKHIIKNVYTDNAQGGSVGITFNNETINPESGYLLHVRENTPVVLHAMDQPNIADYQRVWHQNTDQEKASKWAKYMLGQAVEFSYNRDYSFTTDKDERTLVDYGAYLKKVCNVTFQNCFADAQGGTMRVNGSVYNSPSSPFTIVESNPIQGETIDQSINEIYYCFDHWSDGSTSRNRTFNPTVHGSISAFFRGTPLFNSFNFNTYNPRFPNTHIIVSWTDHPNTNVTQYQVWRRIVYKKVPQPEELLTTVNRGTTSYTDNDFFIRASEGDYIIYYNIRAYYSIDGTYSSFQNFKAAYGESSGISKSTAECRDNEVIKEYAVGNYPNPFNPTTTINYQLPEPGFVTLKVYDMLGKEVAVLVNEYKDQGSYNAVFEGSSLSSGLYFYELRSNNFVSVKKMMLLR